MKQLLSKAFINLQRRLQILWILLTRRIIWPEITEICLKRATIRQIKGDVEPLSFARKIFGVDIPAPPDFSKELGLPQSFVPSGFSEYYSSEVSVSNFLGQLVFYKKAAVVVELGCFVGWSSAHLALAIRANQRGHLFVVDIAQENLDVTLANLKRLGLGDTTTAMLGGSLEVAPKLPAKIDVLFVDTSHAYPDTLEEILCYAPRIASGGLIVLHDSLSHSGVRQSVAELGGKFRILAFATEFGNGLTVLMKGDDLS